MRFRILNVLLSECAHVAADIMAVRASSHDFWPLALMYNLYVINASEILNNYRLCIYFFEALHL